MIRNTKVILSFSLMFDFLFPQAFVMFWLSRGIRNQYVAAFSATLSMLAVSTSFAWITPVLAQLKNPSESLHLTTIQLSWVVSALQLGFITITIPCGIMINYVGRKPVLLAILPIHITGWILMLCFPNVIILSVGRMIHGFSMGVAFTVVPVYLGEIASDSCRGSLTSMSFNIYWLGFVIEYSVGPFLSFYNFMYFTMAMILPFLLLFAWQPETPYYYAMRGEDEKARKSLEWLRDSTPEQLNEELESIKKSNGSGKMIGFKDLFSTAGDRKAVLVLCAIASVRVLGGNASLLVFFTEVFRMTSNLSLEPEIVTIICGVVMFAGSCTSSYTLEVVGRRPLVLVSCVGSLFCQFLVGTYYYLLFNTTINVSPFNWIPSILMFVYSALCTAGLYPVCTAFTSELFNTNTRGAASSLNNICVSFWSYLLLLIFQPIIDYVGLYANFYIFSLFLLLGCIYFYVSVPETKGKSFLQIRNELVGLNSTTYKINRTIFK